MFLCTNGLAVNNQKRSNVYSVIGLRESMLLVAMAL